MPLRGTFRVFQYGVLVGQILAHVDFLDAQLADLDAQITARVAPYEPIIERLQMIPGAASSACDRLDLADLPRVFCEPERVQRLLELTSTDTVPGRSRRPASLIGRCVRP
jgi:hypothetical protein